MLVTVGAILAALTAVLLSWQVASRISEPIDRLVAYAHSDDPAASPPPPAAITEFETLRQGLVAAHSTLIHRAHHDELTGLPNRTLLRQRLADSIAGEAVASGALLYIDLDRFKQANDTHGHAAGDAVLRIVAKRIRASLRPGDLAARLGGDEFAVIVDDVTGLDQVMPLTTRIIARLHAPFEVEGINIYLGASVGIVMLDDTGATVDELIRRADEALYHAKSTGRGRSAVYGIDMGERRSA